MPAAAARLPNPAGVADPGASRPSAYELGEWERSWDDDGYGAAIEAVRAAIARGDVYQVNLVQHLSAPFAGDPWAVALALRHLAPAAAASLRRRRLDDRLGLARALPRPPRQPARDDADQRHPAGGLDVEGDKDAAEHTMIVDLERNDLARVCEPGSIRWPELMAQRELAGVTHLVSTVEGALRADVAARRDPRGDLPRRLGHRRARRSPRST